MKRAWLYAITILVVLAIATAIYWRRTAPQSRASTIAEHEAAMLARLSRTGRAETVVLGDSIAEMNDLGGLCGTTFNASVAGAAIEDLRRFAPTVLRATRPTKIVLAVGTNDVLLGRPYLARFRADYAALVNRLPVRPFVLVGVDRGDNQFIAAEAKRIGAAYVPPLAKSMTHDGIHPNQAGLKIWRARVAATCPH